MNQPAKFTPEVMAQLVDLLTTADGIADMARITGLNASKIGFKMAPFIAIMRLQGTLPLCACGREKFHAGGCTKNIKKRECAFPGHRREDHPRLAAERAMMIAMLIAGERLVDIEASLGLREGRAIRCMKYLTPEQRAEREAAVVRRKSPRPNLRLVHRGEPITTVDHPKMKRAA